MKKPSDLQIKVAILFVSAIAVFAIAHYLRKEAISHTHITPREVTYTQFITEVNADKVVSAKLEELRAGSTGIFAKEKDKSEITTIVPSGDKVVMEALSVHKVNLEYIPAPEPSSLGNVFWVFGPVLLLVIVWIWLMRRMGGRGAGGAMSFGKSTGKKLEPDQVKTRFTDVAGCDEAKEEVKEFVDFLKDPTRFSKLGGRIPRGALMVGSPGTGKTLLAKAIAGEAGVPFMHISGSDFVEMFVGVGAARVRDLFAQAKKHAPCIIFIDEIDAVGRQRGAGVGGGNDEREQTLNQILVEMDGFSTDQTIIVIAATNRPDVLDPALLRPGRFDRQVTVSLPDIKGREQILLVHMKGVPVSPTVDVKVLARGTPGFSGADLANLVNEAALMGARRNAQVVEMQDFEKAKDKIMMGTERRSMVLDPDDLKNTAVHESGHAIVARLVEKTDPVHKVTIIPRGRALGVTMQLPSADRHTYDLKYMLDKIAILCAGRICEEVFMGQITTGASSDFQRATDMARDIVTKYGMTEKLGVMVYAENQGEVFLGRSVTQTRNVSEKTMQDIDAEIRRILEEQYHKAKLLILENRDKVEAMTQALLQYETLDARQIDQIMNGEPVTV